MKDIGGEILCGTLFASLSCVTGIISHDSQSRSLRCSLPSRKAISQTLLVCQASLWVRQLILWQHKSASAEKAKELYDHFLSRVRSIYEADKVKDGVFQAMMVILPRSIQ